MVRYRYVWSAAVLVVIAAPVHGATRIAPQRIASPPPESAPQKIPERSLRDARGASEPDRRDPNLVLLDAPDHVAHHRSVRFCGIPATNPAAAVWHLYSAIERGDLDGLAGRLADDFRFISNDPDFLQAWPEGFDRAGELNFVRRLTESARDVRISYDGIAIEPPTTAFRAAAGTYRVQVTNAAMRIVADGREITAGPSEHWIEVLCLPLPGSESRVATCRVRRWTENASITIAALPPAPDSASAAVNPVADDQPDGLDIRVLSNGRNANPSVALAIPLPGPASFEMYDVAGRRVESREFEALPRGTHRIELPSLLPSGVYWARVRQTGSTRSARVVIVR